MERILVDDGPEVEIIRRELSIAETELEILEFEQWQREANREREAA